MPFVPCSGSFAQLAKSVVITPLLRRAVQLVYGLGIFRRRRLRPFAHRKNEAITGEAMCVVIFTILDQVTFCITRPHTEKRSRSRNGAVELADRTAPSIYQLWQRWGTAVVTPSAMGSVIPGRSIRESGSRHSWPGRGRERAGPPRCCGQGQPR